ncbi:MAG: ACP S-malonyltransferase [Deltaproteobacteria bacterium]|nr:MAG: ACP S-malonyltransferase [Deltaproteobacteria bacterium]
MKLAFVFPGQGSQYVGMGQALAREYPEARAALDEADAALKGGLLRMMSDGPEEELRKTANTQPAILAVSVAAHRALVREAGGTFKFPAFHAGHSLGEYSALVAAGALSLSDAVRAVRARGTFMQEAVPAGEGAMAAILGLEAPLVKEACAEAARQEKGRVVAPANYNSPEQTVIAGHAAAVDRAIVLCKEKGAKRAMALPVSAPFHCSLMSPVQPRLAEVLGTVQFKQTSIPVIANATAEANTDPALIVPLLLTQVTAPVRWVETIQKMALNGVDTLIELGPGKVLTGLTRRIDKGLRAYAVEDPAGLKAVLAEVFR